MDKRDKSIPELLEGLTEALKAEFKRRGIDLDGMTPDEIKARLAEIDDLPKGKQ